MKKLSKPFSSVACSPDQGTRKSPELRGRNLNEKLPAYESRGKSRKSFRASSGSMRTSQVSPEKPFTLSKLSRARKRTIFYANDGWGVVKERGPYWFLSKRRESQEIGKNHKTGGP